MLVGFCGTVVVADSLYRISVMPPAHVLTFEDYLAHMRPPRWLERVEREGETYVVAYGNSNQVLAAMSMFPSGPPAYLFDARGRLVQWSADSGDDAVFQEYWMAGSNKIDLAEARRLTSRVPASAPSSAPAGASSQPDSEKRP